MKFLPFGWRLRVDPPTDEPPHDADVKFVYASELLDEHSCGPCSRIDGYEWRTWAEAAPHYPGERGPGTGGYWACESPRGCRGTLVTVHTDETDPPE